VFTKDILVGFCPIDLALEKMFIRGDPGWLAILSSVAAETVTVAMRRALG
jgi:hypothetical protein